MPAQASPTQHDDRRHQGRHLLRADLSLPEMLGRLIEARFLHRLGLEHLHDPITLDHLLGVLHGRGERLHHAVAKLPDSPVAAGNQPSEHRHGGQERNRQDPAHVQHPADQADHHQAVPDQDGEAFRCRRGHALDVTGDARQEIAGSRVVVGFRRKLEQARKHFPSQVPDQARTNLRHAGRAEVRAGRPQHENPDQRQRHPADDVRLLFDDRAIQDRLHQRRQRGTRCGLHYHAKHRQGQDA